MLRLAAIKTLVNRATSLYNPVVLLKSTAAILTIMLLIGCSRQPSEKHVKHLGAVTSGADWLRSTFSVVGREVKQYDDHSGHYIVLTLKHGDKVITATCGPKWTTNSGEEFPSIPVLYDDCSDVPMGDIQLDRTDWNQLYYFTGAGKRRDETVLSVKKIEVR